jgi:hypothetical protein
MVTTINATNVKINYFYDYNLLVLCVILVINVCSHICDLSHPYFGQV